MNRVKVSFLYSGFQLLIFMNCSCGRFCEVVNMCVSYCNSSDLRDMGTPIYTSVTQDNQRD